jgi:hypothetical protein
VRVFCSIYKASVLLTKGISRSVGLEPAIHSKRFAVRDDTVALKGRNALPLIGRDELARGTVLDGLVEIAPPEDVPGQPSIWPAFVAYLSHGTVVADPYCVFDYDGRPLEEALTLHVSDGSEWLARSKKSEGKEVVELSGWYVCLANWSHTVYFHWFAQCLASLELIEQLALPTSFKLIVPRLNSWQRDSLSELGFQDRQMLQIEEGNVYRCEHLLYPSDLQNQPSVISRRMVSVCRRLRDRIAAKGLVSFPKIYVSRLDAPHRVLTDEGALIDELRKRGYQTLITSMMDFRHEVLAFVGARIIVGAVGSGMTNIAFAQPGVEAVLLNCLGPHYQLYNRLGERCGVKVRSIPFDRPETAADAVSPWKLGSELERVVAEVEAAERSIGI